MTTIRTKIIGGSLGTAAVIAVIAVPALSGSASASTGSDFTVHAHRGTDSSIDLGRKGFSAGDEDLNTDSLTRGGKKVGWLAGSCTTVRAGSTSADQLCEFVLHLGGSQLVTQGVVRGGVHGPGTFPLAITGGAGKYRTARGQILVTATNGTSIPIEVQLAG
jgi:hypothetical protein